MPLMLGLMTSVLMTLIDTLFIGQLGMDQLAAVPFASLVYLIGWILLVGILENSIAFLARAE
jgi:Na+-driven multidrug efflux pump